MVVLGFFSGGFLPPFLGVSAAWTSRSHATEVRFDVVEGGVEVHGLSEDCVAGLEGLEPQDLARILRLHVEDEAMPAIPGRLVLIAGKTLRFEPGFPLESGVHYLAVLRLDEEPQVDELRHEFVIPMEEKAPTTRVEAVYPSSPELPENLLRFYVHFTAPMRRGDSYRHLSLLDHRGRPVEDAFLELEEELWDVEGRRLTLLFDPGRIKSGLKPKLEVGSALDIGHHFELVVESAWRDAEGTPLVEEYRHPFRTVPPDYRSSNPRAWRLSAPRAGTRDELMVELDEPLDRALLGHLLGVKREGEPLEGQIEVSAQETLWSFVPDTPWVPALHQLSVDVRLEDRAGNRIDRLFERDLQAGPGTTSEGPSHMMIDFEVAPR